MEITTLYFEGKEYNGPAAYINGFNGYTATEDDGYLCALVEKSCWDDNRNPNLLLTKDGNTIHDANRRGQEVFIDKNFILPTKIQS